MYVVTIDITLEFYTRLLVQVKRERINLYHKNYETNAILTRDLGIGHL